MVKVRVGARLKVAVGGDTKKVPANPELVRLTQSYKVFVKKLQSLIKHVKANHDAMLTISRTTEAVAHDVANLSHSTPLYEHVGRRNPRAKQSAEDDDDGDDDDDDSSSEEEEEKEEETRSSSSSPTKKESRSPTARNDSYDENNENNNDLVPCSYLAIHQGWATNARRQRSTYGKLVLEYVVQWEAVVTTRINADLKTAERLRVELVHYQNKVETLQKSVDSLTAKGKSPKEDLVEKLQRNVEKCKETREQYQECVENLCILLDEVVHRSWRDLQPLVLEMARLDIQFSVEKQKTLDALKDVVTQIKRAAPGSSSVLPRFKDLETKSPKELSTKEIAPAGDYQDVVNKDNDQQEQPPASNKAKSAAAPALKAGEDEEIVVEAQVVAVSKEPQLFISCATGEFVVGQQ